MNKEYNQLIEKYYSEPKSKFVISNYAAYLFGLFLFIAPFVPRLALPMAVATLSYFILVFSALAVKDVGVAIINKYSESVERLIFSVKLLKYQIRYYLFVLEYSLRNAFALKRARAL